VEIESSLTDEERRVDGKRGGGGGGETSFNGFGNFVELSVSGHLLLKGKQGNMSKEMLG
jgi:hypothetical protein